MSWYTDALNYANKLANGEWKEGEQEEVKKVLSFIGGMHDKATDCVEVDSLYNVFENGYCYYFAQILNLAFPKMGEVFWIRNRGHFVWKSNLSNICYDISGIYIDYEDGDLIKIERIGALLKDFKHNGEEYRCYNPSFEDWCDKYHFIPIFAITSIYKSLPELSGKKYSTWDELYFYIADAAIKFWEDSDANKKACLHAVEAELRKDKF